MAGKHSKGKDRPGGKTVWIVLAALAVLLGAVLIWACTRPVVEISGEEAILAAGDAPDEVKAPEEEPEERPGHTPVPADPSDEIQAPLEEPEDEELGAGPEVPGTEETLTSAPRPAFAEIYDGAGIQPVYQMADREGEGYAVLARGNVFTGISQYEFVYDSQDRVTAMAETHYAFYEGATPEDLEGLAEAIGAEAQPPEPMDNVAVTCEAADGYVLLRIRMEGMDDPHMIDALTEIAFIPYTSDDYLYFTRTRDNLVNTIGYVER